MSVSPLILLIRGTEGKAAAITFYCPTAGCRYLDKLAEQTTGEIVSLSWLTKK